MYDVKHIVMHSDVTYKTIISVLMVSTDIFISILARAIGLAAMPVIMSFSTFKTDVILYVYYILHFISSSMAYVHPNCPWKDQ
jgi:hypothetical protein